MHGINVDGCIPSGVYRLLACVMLKQNQPCGRTLYLRRIDAGLYVDGVGGCYLCISEFIAAYKLPDVPAVRDALLEEASLCFPEIVCVELSG